MKKQELDVKFFDLIHGNLSSEKEKEAITDLLESGLTLDEIESFRAFNKHLDDDTIPEPSDRMDKRFYAMLKEEERRTLLGEPDIDKRNMFTNVLKGPGFRLAAGIALFILGWVAASWFGNQPANENKQLADLSAEVKQLKETLVLSMIQQSSPVERIKAVNMVNEFDNPDSRIIESLIGLLDYDNNDNVRLLALDALIRYSSVPEVRDGLISSISVQTSPLVQLRLTEIMLALNEKRAIPEFKKMLLKSNLDYSVRGKISNAVSVLL
jgi:Tfp pilus assembly protein PilN